MPFCWTMYLHSVSWTFRRYIFLCQCIFIKLPGLFADTLFSANVSSFCFFLSLQILSADKLHLQPLKIPYCRYLFPKFTEILIFNVSGYSRSSHCLLLFAASTGDLLDSVKSLSFQLFYYSQIPISRIFFDIASAIKL